MLRQQHMNLSGHNSNCNTNVELYFCIGTKGAHCPINLKKDCTRTDANLQQRSNPVCGTEFE